MEQGQEEGGGSSSLRGRANFPAIISTKGQRHLSQGQQKAGLSQHRPQISIGVVPVAHCANTAMGNHSCSRITDPDMALGHGLGPVFTMAPGSSTVHADLHNPRSNMSLGYQHGLRCWHRHQASSRPSVVTGALDFDTDYSCRHGPWWQPRPRHHHEPHQPIPCHLHLFKSTFLLRT